LSAAIIGAAGLACLLLPHSVSLRIALVSALSAAGTWLYFLSPHLSRTPLQHVAWLGAALCLLWSTCGAAGLYRDRRSVAASPGRVHFVTVAHMAALLFGVIAAVVQSLVLVMRFTFASIDAVRGYPWNETLHYGFGPDGLWSLGLLSVSCAVSAASMPDRRLVTCQIWLAVILACWLCLLRPGLEPVGAAAYGRTPAFLHLGITLSGIAFVTAAALRWTFSGEARSAQRAGRDPGDDDRPFLPGFWVSYRILAVCVILLTCYHLLVPLDRMSGGAAACGAWSSVCAGLLALSALTVMSLPGGWHGSDVLVGSGSLALCGAATMALPASWDTLGERYPVMFNAMIVGLTVACVLCVRIAHAAPGVGVIGNMGGFDRILQFSARRFVFLNGALAVLIATAMALWPRLPTIATMDDSLGRVTSGMGANLALLLALLWCSRKQPRPSFHLLTLMCAASTVGFLVVRILPYTSSIR